MGIFSSFLNKVNREIESITCIVTLFDDSLMTHEVICAPLRL